MLCNSVHRYKSFGGACASIFTALNWTPRCYVPKTAILTFKAARTSNVTYRRPALAQEFVSCRKWKLSELKRQLAATFDNCSNPTWGKDPPSPDISSSLARKEGGRGRKREKCSVLRTVSSHVSTSTNHLIPSLTTWFPFQSCLLLRVLCAPLGMNINRQDLKNVFWDVVPCGSCKNRCFGGTCRVPPKRRFVQEPDDATSQERHSS
jgi:hypothetical protein